MNYLKTVLNSYGLIYLLLFCFFGYSCQQNDKNLSDQKYIYSDLDLWAYFPQESKYEVDVFFVAPTVFGGDSVNFNMSLRSVLDKHCCSF